jgi:hypothetical protein
MWMVDLEVWMDPFKKTQHSKSLYCFGYILQQIGTTTTITTRFFFLFFVGGRQGNVQMANEKYTNDSNMF